MEVHFYKKKKLPKAYLCLPLVRGTVGCTTPPPHTASRPHAGANAFQPRAPRGPEPPARQPPTAPGRGQVRSKGPIPVPAHHSTLPYHPPPSVCQEGTASHMTGATRASPMSLSARGYPAPSSTPAAAALKGEEWGQRPPAPHRDEPHSEWDSPPQCRTPAPRAQPPPPPNQQPTGWTTDIEGHPPQAHQTQGHQAHTAPQTPPYHHPGRHPA